MPKNILHKQYRALLSELDLLHDTQLATRLLIASNEKHATKAFIKKKNGQLTVTRHDVNQALMLLAIKRMGVDITKLQLDDRGVFTNILKMTSGELK